MPSDDTILEGPVTPAPLFAYRAIRGIFFASPESSPDHDNKENLVPTYPSPSKRKPVTGISLQLSPSQKRKRDSSTGGGTILSPTKGILRTPGLATPRAKYLKDVNVKFKSVSPEAPKFVGCPASPGQPQTRAQDASPVVRPSKPIHILASPTEATSSSVVLQKPLQNEEPVVNTSTESAPPTSPCMLSRTAIEAYMAQTEKEMKKLVRYGQKMREYARKKDAENQELKSMIEQLRRENERLKRDTDPSAESHTNTGGIPLIGKELKNNKEEKRVTADMLGASASPALRNKRRGYVREEVDRVETTVRSQTFGESKAQRHVSSSSTGTAERSTAGSCEPSRPSGSSCSDIPPDHSPTIRRSTSSSQPKSSSSTPLIALPINPPLPADVDLPGTTTSTRSTSANITVAAKSGTISLPPDRLAAARDRLRRRAERRKASIPLQIDSALDKQGSRQPVDLDQAQPLQRTGREWKQEQELVKEPEDPSEVDWANL
ncbi:uncharacterized protein Z519_12235 [Cladophialophora bantiana CBS 173.52]|uniref:Spindle pole body-associated protein cut12 domain-containing protein n=1 Tax=Cladophialophora bantiana (strain ATCC 10958 / CBS 173.52 / CDC B-1940 / NIH 8579) TaxID=1442370 RepID=A0A0D2HRX1_CLAB1|nr:uncharacterized protein Z519_12235 [Cladophialophora bantiana CBS 173.52]KIW87124.1 hypothetical protein Z519_12235 [Cladophialophora bantiana CBS 173.52]